MVIFLWSKIKLIEFWQNINVRLKIHWTKAYVICEQEDYTFSYLYKTIFVVNLLCFRLQEYNDKQNRVHAYMEVEIFLKNQNIHKALNYKKVVIAIKWYQSSKENDMSF